MTDFGSIFYRHADNVDVYTMNSHSFEEACKEAVAAGLIDGALEFSGFTVDCKGRIWHNGVHVAWLNKGCAVNELREFVHTLGTSCPILDDIAMVVEAPDEQKT